jgi:hypothetical protein
MHINRFHCLEGTKADGAPESCIQYKTYGEHAQASPHRARYSVLQHRFGSKPGVRLLDSGVIVYVLGRDHGTNGVAVPRGFEEVYEAATTR